MRLQPTSLTPEAVAATCTGEPGRLVPEVNRGRCEGKRECEVVCPYQVFAVGRISDTDHAALGWLARLKVLAHGRLTAYTPREANCRACGLYVTACPERAIKLVRSREP